MKAQDRSQRPILLLRKIQEAEDLAIPRRYGNHGIVRLVEVIGFEPTASRVQGGRSPD